VDETGGAVLEKPTVLHAEISNPPKIATTAERKVTRRNRITVSDRIDMFFFSVK